MKYVVGLMLMVGGCVFISAESTVVSKDIAWLAGTLWIALGGLAVTR